MRHVVVEDDGHVVGIASARDLLGGYAAAELDAADVDQTRETEQSAALAYIVSLLR